jgi:phosphohistidine phosphatase SixA/ketosteroid isomerase-like protein
MRCRPSSLAWLLASFAVLHALRAQELPPIEIRSDPPPRTRPWTAGDVEYAIQLPPQWTLLTPVPVLVVFAGARNQGEAKAAVAGAGAALPRAGFVVVSPVGRDARGGEVRDLRKLFAQLRRTVRVDQGGMHALLRGDLERATALLLGHRHEFQTVTVDGPADAPQLSALRRLPARRVHAVGAADPDALAAHFTKLHAERTLPGVAGEVARRLDDFHDAAANADATRYFTILPDDAVFLGTDGTERWTGAEFRRDYAKYFDNRSSAWTYVALQRHVDVEPGDQVAWFDETFDNEAYGECRGSGVMAKRDGEWVLRQYHLTVPVPNDLARDVARRIRTFQDGVAEPGPTTIVLVRHAEKADDSRDPSLSAAGRARAEALARVLRDLPLTNVFVSQFRRTAETVAPLCAARSLTPVPSPANDSATLAATLQQVKAGNVALVCGHSNTVPELLKALGVPAPPAIGDDEYDRLFVVSIDARGARLLSLRY